jgi:hypothetical protein
MDHHDSHNTANLPHGTPYGFYPTEQEANFDMVYPQQGMNNYSVVPAAPPPRGYHLSSFSLVFSFLINFAPPLSPFRTPAGFSDAAHEPHGKHAPSPV